MMKSIWLFRFTSYSYCQGTRDSYRGDMRLLQFTLPCDKEEAIFYLHKELVEYDIEFDENSIEDLSIFIRNS